MHVNCNVFILLFKLVYVSQLHREVDITLIKLLRSCSKEFLDPLSLLRVFLNRIKHSRHAPLEILIICIFKVHKCLPFYDELREFDVRAAFNGLYSARWMSRDITIWNLQLLLLWLKFWILSSGTFLFSNIFYITCKNILKKFDKYHSNENKYNSNMYKRIQRSCQRLWNKILKQDSNQRIESSA